MSLQDCRTVLTAPSATPIFRDDDVTSRGSWIPPVDIYETASRDLVLKAELPDMSREDIEVTVEHNTLRLKGTKKGLPDVKDEQYRRIERNYGTFSRSSRYRTRSMRRRSVPSTRRCAHDHAAVSGRGATTYNHRGSRRLTSARAGRASGPPCTASADLAVTLHCPVLV